MKHRLPRLVVSPSSFFSPSPPLLPHLLSLESLCFCSSVWIICSILRFSLCPSPYPMNALLPLILSHILFLSMLNTQQLLPYVPIIHDFAYLCLGGGGTHHWSKHWMDGYREGWRNGGISASVYVRSAVVYILCIELVQPERGNQHQMFELIQKSWNETPMLQITHTGQNESIIMSLHCCFAFKLDSDINSITMWPWPRKTPLRKWHLTINAGDFWQRKTDNRSHRQVTTRGHVVDETNEWKWLF